LLGRGEQVVAPGDGVAHRAQAIWRVGWAIDQDGQCRCEAGQQLGGAEEAHLHGGQLDGQRQTIQATADGRNRRRIVGVEDEARLDGLRPLDEELDRRRSLDLLAQYLGVCFSPSRLLDFSTCRQGQGRNREPAFARDAEPCAARRQHGESWASSQECGHLRCGSGHLLDIVQDQQQAPLVQMTGEKLSHRLGSCLVKPELPRNRGEHELWIGDRREGHKDNTVRKCRCDFFGEPHGQTRFADASRAGQRQQPHLVVNQVDTGRRDLGVPANE
jgi:hypothetical protein